MIVLYIFLGVLGVFILLLLIALFNSYRIKDKNMNIKPLPIDKERTEAYAKEFSEMIKIPTVSYSKELNNFLPISLGKFFISLLH